MELNQDESQLGSTTTVNGGILSLDQDSYQVVATTGCRLASYRRGYTSITANNLRHKNAE